MEGFSFYRKLNPYVDITLLLIIRIKRWFKVIIDDALYCLSLTQNNK